jgi:hypothetical protein
MKISLLRTLAPLLLGSLSVGGWLWSQPAGTTAGGTGIVINELVSPAGPDTGESSLYTGPDGTTYLTWSGPSAREGERALRLSRLAPGSATWSEPTIIVSTPLLMENWADFATLTVATDGALWAQWFQRPDDAAQRGYDGWFARSADGGKTWSDPAPLGHEFVSLAPLPGGRVLAVWLQSIPRPRGPDGKPLPRVPGEPSIPSMRLDSCVLGPDGKVLREWTVDPDVCNCCQTSLTVLGDGRVVTTYRGHTPGEIRDNRFAVFANDSWGAPATIHDDGWLIPACPVNGPAIDARGDQFAVAWFTAAGGKGRVLARHSPDATANFGPVSLIDLGAPMGRLDLTMLEDRTAVVTWMEAQGEGKVAGIYARRLFTDGTMSPAVLIAESSQARTSGFPRIALRADNRIVMSWTQDTEVSQVRVVEFSLTGNARERVIAVSDPDRPGVILELCGPTLADLSHP